MQLQINIRSASRSSLSPVKHHSESHIIKTTVMHQSKGLNCYLKLEHKKKQKTKNKKKKKKKHDHNQTSLTPSSFGV